MIYYRKLFGSLNPPRFSIDGNYPGTNRNLKFPIVSDCYHPMTKGNMGQYILKNMSHFFLLSWGGSMHPKDEPLELTKLMLRSYLETGPTEFVELEIWASSESSPGLGGTLCDIHIQVECLAYIFRAEVGPSPSGPGRSSTQCSTNLPDFWLAPSGERQPNIYGSRLNACSMGKCGSGGVIRPGPFYRGGGGGRVARDLEIAEKARSSFTPPENATRSERFLNLDRGVTNPRTSLQILRRICQFS